MTTDVPADAAYEEEERLPWLEAVEEEESGPSAGKLIAAVLIGLVAIGIVVGGLFWLGNRAATGEEELIASPGDYKVPAPEPGGMQLDNRSSTQVRTSDGAEQNATIAADARPETPVNQPAQPAPQRPTPPAAQAQGQAQPARPQQQAQAPAQPRLSGPTIQVGAYPSAEAASGEWTRLTRQYPYLRPLQHAVMVHRRGGQTFYRLRAAGRDAPAVCRRLREAGQPCMDVRD